LLSLPSEEWAIGLGAHSEPRLCLFWPALQEGGDLGPEAAAGVGGQEGSRPIDLWLMAPGGPGTNGDGKCQALI
jgi:hypothetical protein